MSAREVAEGIIQHAMDVPLEEFDEALIAAITAALLAERERCAKVADAYAEANIELAGDSILLSPALHGDLSPDAYAKEQDLQIDGCIHSSMFHAAQNIAAAIRQTEEGK